MRNSRIKPTHVLALVVALAIAVPRRIERVLEPGAEVPRGDADHRRHAG